MVAARYATLCAILCGIANLLLWCGFDASVLISTPVLNSVNRRAPDRIGAHDGYYGMAVTNVVFMLANLVAPSLSNYFRGKWILSLTSVLFLLYFLSFQLINRFVFFAASSVLGIALATFNVGYSGYLTEFSTRTTIARNTALTWGISSFGYTGAAIVNLAITTMSLRENNETASKYREYSDTEIRYFYGALVPLCSCATALYASLPKAIEGNIASSNVKTTSVVEQFKLMLSVITHSRVLLLVPFYFYHGLFYVFFTSIIPTAFQFTKVLSLNVYIPAIFGCAFTIGTVITSVKDFSLKPLMAIDVLLHLAIYAITVCTIPEWSTVKPNDEPSLLVQPNVFLVPLLAFLFGAADAANNSARIVISSLLLPETKQQTFGASKVYHGLAACLILFSAPALSIYMYVAIHTALLAISTVLFFLTCDWIGKRDRIVMEIRTYTNEISVCE